MHQSHPRLACNKERYRYAETPALPAQWLYGLHAFSSVSGLVGHRHLHARGMSGRRPSSQTCRLDPSVGTVRCLPQPEQLQGLRARTEQGREWMMAQNDLVVVGIDVAKDKGDAVIRALGCRQAVPNTAQGHRKLVAWLRKHKVSKAVMEASGGYERAWARVLR